MSHVTTRHSWAGVLALFLAYALPAGANEEVYRKAVAATVMVYRNDGVVQAGSGTGFLIDAQERLVVTARHVVEETTGGISGNVAVIFAESRDGEVIAETKHYRDNYRTLAIKAKVVYESVRRDLAVLKLDRLPAGVKHLELAGSRARPGQTVHFIGNSSERFGCVFSYYQGHVRNVFLWETMGANVVTTQAPANSGDSGGPMLNNLGEVVGIAIMSTSAASPPKTGTFRDVQLTEISTCVTELRDALQEMRQKALAAKDAEIRASVHLVMMEKDIVYRITVTADGFVPDVRVDNQLMSTASPVGREIVLLFTPKETKEYRLQIAHLRGEAVGKGAMPYTLNIEKAAFQTDSILKEGQLKVNEYVHKLEANKSYRISVRSKSFFPELQVLDGGKSVAVKFGDTFPAGGVGAAQREFETALTFTPTRTADYRLQVSIGPSSPATKDPLDYVVNVLEQKVSYSASDELTLKEPRKIHHVKLEAGKTYQIDLVTSQFDGKLTLDDRDGNLLKKGEDHGQFGSRILFSPTRTDTYHLTAGSFGQNALGQFSLTVAELAGPPPGKK